MPPVGRVIPCATPFFPKPMFLRPSLFIYIGLACSLLIAAYFLVDKKIKIVELFLAIGTIIGFVGITQLWISLQIYSFW